MLSAFLSNNPHKEQALLQHQQAILIPPSIKVHITQHRTIYLDKHSAVFSQGDTLKESKLHEWRQCNPLPPQMSSATFFTVNHILYTARRYEWTSMAHILGLYMQHLPVRWTRPFPEDMNAILSPLWKFKSSCACMALCLFKLHNMNSLLPNTNNTETLSLSAVLGSRQAIETWKALSTVCV